MPRSPARRGLPSPPGHAAWTPGTDFPGMGLTGAGRREMARRVGTQATCRLASFAHDAWKLVESKGLTLGELVWLTGLVPF